MELTFSRFMKMLLDKLWLLILVVVIAGLAAYSISSFLIKPKYESGLSFMIKSENTSGDANTTFAKSIKPDYIAYTKSDSFLKEIELGLKNDNQLTVSVDELKSYISITSDTTNSTEFVITVSAYSSRTAFLISKQLYNKGSDIYKASNLFRGSEAFKANEPKENINPVSPNIPLNTVLGIILGLILGVFLIISIETIDNSIKDENDLIDNYEIPLLGVVYAHAIDTVESKK